MYLEELPNQVYTTTIVKIKYDCCQKEHSLKYKDANANFIKNNQRHICRPCWLKSDANPAKQKENQDKAKKTNLERYGATCAMNTAENTKVRVEKMFGTEESTKKIVEKRKKTSTERYGEDHIMKTDIGLQRLNAAMQERHGVDFPLQSTEIKEKMQQTVRDRHGVDNVAQLPEVQDKMKSTMFERYGVEHYNELPEMKDYLRDNCAQWLQESWAAGGPNKGIARPEAWSQKQSETMTRRILNGELNPNDTRFFVTGYFFSNKCKKPKAFFRSRLELMMHYILHTDTNVDWYENEPFSITYEKSPGVIRRYIPDFFVNRKNDIPLLIEVKPSFRMRVPEVEIKAQAGIDFCKIHNFEFSYADEVYLKKESISLEQLSLLPFVEIIKRTN